VKRILKIKHKRRRLPYWVALIIGIIAVCLLGNFLTFIFQTGILLPWKSLPKLQSKVVHILDADPYNVWVQTNDDRIFVLTLDCCTYQKYHKWLEVDSLEDVVPFLYHHDIITNEPIKRGVNCDNLSIFNPWIGKTTECVLTRGLGPEFAYETYFVLKPNGTVMYWEHGDILNIFFFSFLSSIVLPILVAIICSGIYLMILFIRKRKNTN
jgi:hypothetical protein